MRSNLKQFCSSYHAVSKVEMLSMMMRAAQRMLSWKNVELRDCIFYHRNSRRFLWWCILAKKYRAKRWYFSRLVFDQTFKIALNKFSNQWSGKIVSVTTRVSVITVIMLQKYINYTIFTFLTFKIMNKFLETNNYIRTCATIIILGWQSEL